MYEQLFDEATKIVWTNSEEEGERLYPQWESLIQQFIQSPAEVLPILMNELRGSEVYRKTVAVLLIDALGYPACEPAIPLLLSLIGGCDPNSPAWTATIQTLDHMGLTVVLPHLIRAFLEKGEPYHQACKGEVQTSWEEDIEGLSMMLSRTKLPSEWARQCCPTINFLLAQMNQDEALTVDVAENLLAIVEHAGNEVTYLLPTLIALTKKYEGDRVGRKARDLMFSYSQKELAAYVLVLAQPS